MPESKEITLDTVIFGEVKVKIQGLGSGTNVIHPNNARELRLAVAEVYCWLSGRATTSENFNFNDVIEVLKINPHTKTVHARLKK